jgi:hypothetical protein
MSVAGNFTTDKRDFTTEKSGFTILRSTCELCPSLALLTALWGRDDSWSVRRCRCCRWPSRVSSRVFAEFVRVFFVLLYQ